MKLRYTLADKINMTIVLVGIISIVLVYYISDSYKQLAYQHHARAIKHIATIKADELITDLKRNSLDLALTIENEKDFESDFKYGYAEDLRPVLDNQFHQYFVTAGVLKLLKLYILDTDYTLISTSSEGIDTDADSEIICNRISQLALNRTGSEKLQTLSGTCTHKNHPVFAVIVPFGGLNPKGYIQVITDLAYSLEKIDQSLAMPIQITLLDGSTTYQSKNWELMAHNENYINLEMPIDDGNGRPIVSILLKSDMTDFSKEIRQHRNSIMAIAFTTTALTVLIVILILRQSTIPPLARIHDVLDKIYLHSHSHIYNKDSHLLFEQLLEQIIRLKQQYRSCFTVMILDLSHFNRVNTEFGENIGDMLLIEVEKRLGDTLRNSDLISWVGTDTPGHKLLPTGTKTRYHATIARLGGDEFGLLLPSAETREQATRVAHRIVEALTRPFDVDGHTIDIECIIGISIYPTHGEDEKTLIRKADKAMNQAKTGGLNISVYATE